MDSFIGRIKSAADIAGTSASVAQEKAIQEYLPKIISILKEKAGPAVLEVLADTTKLTELARSTYQALPMPVRLIVKEQSFIDWVTSHQDSVVEKVKSQLVLESSEETPTSALPPGEVDDIPK